MNIFNKNYLYQPCQDDEVTNDYELKKEQIVVTDKNGDTYLTYQTIKVELPPIPKELHAEGLDLDVCIKEGFNLTPIASFNIDSEEVENIGFNPFKLSSILHNTETKSINQPTTPASAEPSTPASAEPKTE